MAFLLTLLGACAAALSFECDKAGASDINWIMGTTLEVGGKAYNDSTTETRYSRLPAAAKGQVREIVWSLSTQPAGQFLQFETDASCIFVKYTLQSPSIAMWHYPSTGVAGMDLYGWDDRAETWRWTGTSHPSYPITLSKLASATCPDGRCPVRAYRLHLPPYAAIVGDALLIGVNPESKVFGDDRSHLAAAKPIIWYGTSILQGAVASRPGQMHTHITSRGVETEIFNFGFSGNGIMELSVAQYFVDIDASLIIIDCNPNMNATGITARTVPLVNYLRTNGHPTTPIVLSEGTMYGADWSLGNKSNNGLKNVALSAEYAKLIAAGVTNLHYAKTEDITSAPIVSAEVSGPLVDATVGGTHLTDLGMRKQSSFWVQFIKGLRASAAADVMSATGSTEVPPPPARAETKFELNETYLAAERAESDSIAVPDMEIDPTGTGPHASSTDTDTDLSNLPPSPPIPVLAFVGGRSFPSAQRNHTFDRFPLKYAATLRPDVWQLGEMSTGVYLRFTTDAYSFNVNWKLRPVCAERWFAGCHLFHMPDSGTSAMDTFVYEPATRAWRHFPNGLLHYAESGSVFIYSPTVLRPEGNITYLIYLPLRNAPAAISLQLYPPTASIAGASSPVDMAPKFATPPIVWYGTSIQQGGVAARAGNTYDAILSRTLSREVYNVGFADNGVMELSVAAMVADIAEAAAIVIDCLPNMDAEQVTNRTAPLVRYIRDNGHPTTPIVLAEGTPTPADWFNASINGVVPDPRNTALRAQYDALVAAGVTNLHYVTAGELFIPQLTNGSEGKDVNPTVCGVHSSDLGQYELAAFYTGFFRTLLG